MHKEQLVSQGVQALMDPLGSKVCQDSLDVTASLDHQDIQDIQDRKDSLASLERQEIR